MEQVRILRNEHEVIRGYLIELEYLAERGFARVQFDTLLNKMSLLWDIHEKQEEVFFDLLESINNRFQNKKMLLKEHRELRGHWRVLKEAVKSGDFNRCKVAFDTDGRMLAEKVRIHIEKEDMFLSDEQFIKLRD